MSEPPENDETRYADRALALSSTNPVVQRAGKAVGLFGAGLAMVPRCEWQSVFPNDFAAIACLSRAHRQLMAACNLMMWGYCPEVRLLLRAAYEASGLARMLAHDPTRAEKWVLKEHWFPDREVRKWFADSGSNSLGGQDDVRAAYNTAYQQMSRRSHPTAIACVSALSIDERGPAPQLSTVFDENEFLGCAAEIAATAIFACFALRNAAVDERVIHPQWRRDVYELGREIVGTDMFHLDRDWAAEQENYEKHQRKVQAAANLNETLGRDPRSWLNLTKSEPPNRV